MSYKNISYLVRVVLLSFILSTNGGTLKAAPAGGVDAGQLLRQELDLEKLRNLPQAATKPVLGKEKAKSTTAVGPKILVRAFRFEGELKSITQGELQDLLTEFVNKELDFNQLQSATGIISDYFAKKGFFLAKAVIPKQEVVDGIVVIFINEGKLDSKEPIRIMPNKLRLDPDRVTGYITQALSGELHQGSLERGLLNLNDNPGVSSSADLEPGNDPLSTRIIVDVTEGPLVDGSLTFDNFGSRYTGDTRFTGVVNLNSPFGKGDQLSLTAIQGLEEVFQMQKLGYTFPIGLSGLRGSVSYTSLYFELGKEMATTPPSLGKAAIWSFALKYPLYRTATQAVYLSGGYDWKYSYNESSGTPSSEKVLETYNTALTLESADQLFGGGFSQLQLAWVVGNVDLAANATSLAADQGAGGPQTYGGYQKYTAQFLRIQRGTDRLSFQFLASGQLAQKNLDGSEKLILGGPTGVRAYPTGEASGDEGYKFSLDAKYVVATGTTVGDIVASVFYDHGQVWQYQNPSVMSLTTPNSFSLSGWGVGLDLVKAGKYMVKLGWARALDGNPGASATGANSDGQTNMSRYWLLVNGSF